MVAGREIFHARSALPATTRRPAWPRRATRLCRHWNEGEGAQVRRYAASCRRGAKTYPEASSRKPDAHVLAASAGAQYTGVSWITGNIFVVWTQVVVLPGSLGPDRRHPGLQEGSEFLALEGMLHTT